MTTSELSAGNARIREAAKLRQKKCRRETGCILIEGARLVADALDAGANIKELFCTAAFLDSEGGRVLGSTADAPPRAPRGAYGRPLPPEVAISAITDAAAAKLSDTRTPQGVFAVAEFATTMVDEVAFGIDALVLVADGISDPGNLGTMIRSAAALGACCAVASGDSCDVLNPKCVRATMGAIFRVPVVADVVLADTIEKLRSRGLCIAAAVAHGGRPPWQVDLERPTALLIGAEAGGLSKESLDLADMLITIPMHHGAESLNAAAGAAALLYEAARQRAKGM
ncbi:MAG: RNA methyltransferase [Planctomycetota bacterium]